ncbi:hypothetical protein BST81_04505 [Leptolyngbya sp. 'hensonii']|uniref:DUF1565 domain-containing protein n=1 Tax=Leptolyngbya sp. 'hensonii' TaxID=1922337 RepID=UPI00094FBD8C|nr:DUF1565 domain-containing protein [Leptolyngbya sp. 'hensonii']OLP19537.1 hypothetical protein BST81_04505 [Leptolyngbya sp. 'hensonii']
MTCSHLKRPQSWPSDTLPWWLLPALILQGTGLTGASLFTFTLLMGYGGGAIAQPSSPMLIAQSFSVRQSSSTITLVYVNSTSGSDVTGNGSEQLPFKTITHALRLARPNSVILLASGFYSVETGEKFPLELKPGVTIQGDPRLHGRGTLIYGGGNYTSPTLGNQNITLLGVNGAGLTGVTVTNPNTSGYGLWIESASPIIVDNTFMGNKRDGISIAGQSAPVIQGNHFYQNGAQGITLQSNTPAALRSGNVAPTPSPGALQPQAVQVSVSPASLQVRTPKPQGVGNSSSPNEIKATSFPVPTMLSGDNSPSPIAAAPVFPQPLTTPPVSRPPAPTPVLPIVQIRPTVGVPQAIATPASPPIARPVISIQPSPQKVATVEGTAIEIPVPPPESAVLRPTGKSIPGVSRGSTPNRPAIPIFSAVVQPNPRSRSGGLSLPAPPPRQGENSSFGGQASIASPGLLPVPGSKIPIGNGDGKSIPPPPSFAVAAGLRYRVLVEPVDETQAAQIQTLVPGAFTTVVQGRRFLQAGAFVDRAKARELMQLLVSHGFRATIQE